jgi:adenylate cyclase
MVLQRTSLPLEGALVLRDRQGLTFCIQVPRVTNVAQRTCVQYLRRSSVRRSGDRLFIAAQFVTARSGDHLWAERFDRNL